MVDFRDLGEGSRKQYRYWWRRWQEWCASHQAPAYPARASDIASYVRHLHAEGRPLSTLRLVVSMLAKAHEDTSVSPAHDAEVRQELLALKRSGSSSLRPDWARHIEEVLVERAGGELYALRNPDDPLVMQAYADVCAAYLKYTEGIQFTEMARLRWGDIDHEKQEVVVTQTRGKRYALTVTNETARALRAYGAGVDSQGNVTNSGMPVFLNRRMNKAGNDSGALTPVHIARRLAHAARSAGLG